MLAQRSHRARVGVLAAMLAVLLTMVLPAARAEAAGGGIDPIVLPAGTVSVWIELEQAGLAPTAAIVSAGVGGPVQPVALTQTTFGVHGQMPAAAGTLRIQVLPAKFAPAAHPDLAVTALGASGEVLLAASLRLVIPAGPSNNDPPSPAYPDGSWTSQDSRGAMARTGADGTGWLVLAAVVLIAAGAGGWLLRARLLARKELGR